MQSVFLYDRRSNTKLSTALSNQIIVTFRREKKGHTLPSEASNNLTGHSRTEVTKQNEAGSCGEAVGNQIKSRIGDAWANVLDLFRCETTP